VHKKRLNVRFEARWTDPILTVGVGRLVIARGERDLGPATFTVLVIPFRLVGGGRRLSWLRLPNKARPVVLNLNRARRLKWA
jgi:hypothetical protein